MVFQLKAVVAQIYKCLGSEQEKHFDHFSIMIQAHQNGERREKECSRKRDQLTRMLSLVDLTPEAAREPQPKEIQC